MARPRKYETEEERRKARCEAVKRCNEKKKPEKPPKPDIEPQQEKVKLGRPFKYETEEERIKGHREKRLIYNETHRLKIAMNHKKYYERNKEKVIQQNKANYLSKKLIGNCNLKVPKDLTELINFVKLAWSKKSSIEQVSFDDIDERNEVMEIYDTLKEDYDIGFSKRDYLQAYLQISFIRLRLFYTKEQENVFNSFFTDDLITEDTLIYYLAWTTIIGKSDYNRIMNIFS